MGDECRAIDYSYPIKMTWIFLVKLHINYGLYHHQKKFGYEVLSIDF
jgi:hypothetical protein